MCGLLRGSLWEEWFRDDGRVDGSLRGLDTEGKRFMAEEMDYLVHGWVIVILGDGARNVAAPASRPLHPSLLSS